MDSGCYRVQRLDGRLGNQAVCGAAGRVVLTSGTTKIIDATVTSGAEVVAELPAGEYDFTITAEKDGIETGDYAAVQVFPGLVSKGAWAFTAASFSARVLIVKTDDVAALAANLSALDANTAESPYTLVFRGIDLTANLPTIRSAVIDSGKYVNLNFAGCAATSIGERAFYGCRSLTTFVVAGTGSFSTVLNGTMLIKNGTEIVAMPSATGLVSIPDGVTFIGDYAFGSCIGLTGITIPDGVASIGDSAFQSCRNLLSITIPGSVTSIGVQAFQSCVGLASITIPAGVASIGNYAFRGCSILASIIMQPAAPPTLGSGVFLGTSNSLAIKVPSANLAAYTTGNTANGWTDDIKAVVEME